MIRLCFHMCEWPHNHTQTYFLPMCMWCEGVSTLGLPCMGGRGLCQGADGGGWVGGQQGTEAAGTARTFPILWPWLGENKQNPDAGFFSFTGTVHYLHLLVGKVAPTAQCCWEWKWKPASCLNFTQVDSKYGYSSSMVAWLLVGTIYVNYWVFNVKYNNKNFPTPDCAQFTGHLI